MLDPTPDEPLPTPRVGVAVVVGACIFVVVAGLLVVFLAAMNDGAAVEQAPPPEITFRTDA